MHPEGRLDVALAPAFREQVKRLLDAGSTKLIIDLGEVSFVDSSGLNALVSLYKATNERNLNNDVTMRLLHPPPPVQQVLELTRIHHLFEIVHRNVLFAPHGESARLSVGGNLLA